MNTQFVPLSLTHIRDKDQKYLDDLCCKYLSGIECTFEGARAFLSPPWRASPSSPSSSSFLGSADTIKTLLPLISFRMALSLSVAAATTVFFVFFFLGQNLLTNRRTTESSDSSEDEFPILSSKSGNSPSCPFWVGNNAEFEIVNTVAINFCRLRTETLKS